METKKVRKDGRYYLLRKIEKLQAEIMQLKMEKIKIEEREKRELIAHESLVSELCEHMGAFRRWLWRLKHGS